MLFRSACGFGAVFALSVSLYAQGRPTAPSPTPSNPGANTPTTGGNSNPFPSTNSTTTNPNGNMGGMERPIFLSGRVMLDDGTAPPESVSIQRICGSNPHTEGYTDSKGRFSFQLGQRLGVLPDASEQSTPRGSGMGMGSGMGNMGQMGSMGGGQRNSSTMLMGCSLRAYLAGYRSDSVDLTNHRSLENPDIGTIILHRVGNVQGQTISATSALAPKDAKKAFEKAQNDKKKEKVEDAQKELVKATTIYPKYAAAWYELGLLQEQAKDDEEAKKSYAQALAADSRYVNPYAQLASIAVRQPCDSKGAAQQGSVASQVTVGNAAPAAMTCEEKWKEAKETTDRLLALDPVNFPDMWFYNAVANYQLKNFEAAEKSARSGLKVDTDHVKPQMNQLLAVLLATKEDYAGAAESLKTYLQFAPNGPEAETVKKQLALIETKLQTGSTAQKEEKQP